MAQNNNFVGYALMLAGDVQQAPAVGQTYHLPPCTLVGEYSHQHLNRRLINDHKLSMGIPHHPKNKFPRICFMAGGCQRSDVSTGLYFK